MHDLSGFVSIGIVARGPLDPYRFNMFITDLLQEKSRDIFRSKGVLCIKVIRGVLEDRVVGLEVGLLWDLGVRFFAGFE